MPDDRTPRQRIESECAARGHAAVVAGCVQLVLGGATDARLLSVLGGPSTPWALEDDSHRYWLRIWGARGLLWAWEPSALDAVIPLQEDPIPRVRTAARRAVVRITQAGA
jgi:hypothetical protein